MAALPQALHPLQPRVEALAARSQATAQTSGRPPASDAPSRTGRNTRHRPTSGRPGATPGPPGGRQRLMSPPATEPLRPTACCCGNPAWLHPTPDSTHQGMALPRIDMHSPHWVVSQADGPRCGRRLQAHRPPAHHSGDGPRRSARIGAMAGRQETRRARIQTWCAAGLGLPIGLGALPQVLDRVPLALQTPSAALARLVRHAPVGDRAATPGLCQGTRPWRWGLTSPQGAGSRIDPSRAKVACAALIAD
jgi:hypothetical protein